MENATRERKERGGARPSEVDVAVLVDLERHSKVSLQRQIVDRLRNAIIDGSIPEGARLPATRKLSADLKISRSTATEAVSQLIAEGYLVARHGSGTYVDKLMSGRHRKEVSARADRRGPTPLPIPAPDITPSSAFMRNFDVFHPSTEHFPVADWRRALIFATRGVPYDDYRDARGEEPLRENIARYVLRSRSMTVSPDQILVTSGVVQAIHILAKAFIKQDDVVAFENPGYPLARQVFEMAGARILPIEVDEEGLCVDQLPRGKRAPRIVYVTPAHQFPVGSRLSLQRRFALLEWAEQHNALIVEDDYDGEFRYDALPLPPLAALSGGHRVAYLGTFSKNMFPSLRLGYLIGSPELLNAATRLKTIFDYHTSSIPQTALAWFMEQGAFDIHVSRMRRLYAMRRQALKDAIKKHQIPGNLVGLDAGLHAFLSLDVQRTEERVVVDAMRKGLAVVPCGRYAFSPTQHAGLILGYSAVPEDVIDENIGILSRSLKATAR